MVPCVLNTYSLFGVLFFCSFGVIGMESKARQCGILINAWLMQHDLLTFHLAAYMICELDYKENIENTI